MPAKPLTSEQIEDAHRLKRIFESKKDELGLTQLLFAELCGWSTQASVSQYLNARIPLNLKALAKFCQILDVDPAEISPKLAIEMSALGKVAGNGATEDEYDDWQSSYESSGSSLTQLQNRPRALNARLTELDDWIFKIKMESSELQKEHPVSDEILRLIQNLEGDSSHECRIPLLSVAGSMGPGEHLTYEGDQIIQFMPVSASWIKDTLKVKPEHLRVITGAGDSMKPTFSHGDLLLVDISSTEVKIDGVYAMSAHKRLFIKRVRQRMDGSFEVSSDNPTVKTVDVLSGDHEVTVHGRVVWAWNGSKL